MTSTLSQSQQDIVDLVKQGVVDVKQLASRLGKSERIIRAQISRIQTKGKGNLVSKVDISHKPATGGGRPTNVSGGSSNKHVLQEAQEAGPAQYELPDELVDAARDYTQDRNVHPMVLLGVTIQFCKLVGGRLSAHQLIEQVYEALRAMVSDGSPKVGEENWSAPWPLNAVEMENEKLKEELATLKKEFGKGTSA